MTFSSGNGPVPGVRDAEAMVAEARRAFWTMVGFLAVIWIVQIVNWLDHYQLGRDFGIKARDPASLPDILSAPFLHASWAHIESNSGPLFIFGFLAAYRGVRKFLYVTALIVVGAGVGAWATNPSQSVAIGASGVVFGYFGYIIVRGVFDRHGIDIVIGLVMALCFAYQFTVLLPTQEGIDWQGHLFGFITGLIGGWVFRDRRRTAVPTNKPPATLTTPTTTKPAMPPTLTTPTVTTEKRDDPTA